MAQALEIESFIFVIILIIYVMASHLIQVRKVPYLHESAIAIFMGMLTALFATKVLDQEIEFHGDIFFAIILPPIIFSAGYSLRKSLFFQNFGMTSFLGVIGTIIGFLCLTFFLILVNNTIFQALSLSQLMLVTSVLCATDTVAAMSLIKPQKYPVLNAVLFGQGIINDAVAIILFRTIGQLGLGDNSEFTYKTVLMMAFDFCFLFFFSLALGVVCGFSLSYLFKWSESFTKHSIKQSSLILLNGYFTYLLGQLCGLSGIICLFTCAIIMGHYCFMNISEQSQRGTGLAFQTVSYIAEAFIFAYLGASVFAIKWDWTALGMALVILLILPFIRAIMVYMLPGIYYVLRKPFPLDSKELKICWYSGQVRGVIAFALCLQIKKQDQGDFIVLVTLVIVMVTTVVGSTMLKSFANCIGVKESADQEEDINQMAYSNMKSERSNYNQGAPNSKYGTIGSTGREWGKNSGKNGRQTQMSAASSQLQPELEVKSRLGYFEKEYIKPIFEKKSEKSINYELDQVRNSQQNVISIGSRDLRVTENESQVLKE